MTQDQFDNMKFIGQMKVKHKDFADPLYLISVDFEERLFGVHETLTPAEGDLSWCRCENVEVVE